MTVDHRQSHLETIRSALSTLVYPVQYVVNMPIEFSRWVRQTVSTHEALVEENEQLHKEQLLLTKENGKAPMMASLLLMLTVLWDKLCM